MIRNVRPVARLHRPNRTQRPSTRPRRLSVRRHGPQRPRGCSPGPTGPPGRVPRGRVVVLAHGVLRPGRAHRGAALATAWSWPVCSCRQLRSSSRSSERFPRRPRTRPRRPWSSRPSAWACMPLPSPCCRSPTVRPVGRATPAARCRPPRTWARQPCWHLLGRVQRLPEHRPDRRRRLRCRLRTAARAVRPGCPAGRPHPQRVSPVDSGGGRSVGSACPRHTVDEARRLAPSWSARDRRGGKRHG